MRSLNALEMSAKSKFWKRWLGRPLPSASTMGNVYAKMDASQLRDAIHKIYGKLKRNKALPDNGGFAVAILDGHESHTRYLQHCSGCLERTVHFKKRDRVQYYHRQNALSTLAPVSLMLVTGAPANREPLRILLDHEPLAQELKAH